MKMFYFIRYELNVILSNIFKELIKIKADAHFTGNRTKVKQKRVC